MDFDNDPNDHFRKPIQHLRKSAPIVNNPDFENDIVNIQQVVAVSPDEMEAVSILMKLGVVSIGDLSYMQNNANKEHQNINVLITSFLSLAFVSEHLAEQEFLCIICMCIWLVQRVWS